MYQTSASPSKYAIEGWCKLVAFKYQLYIIIAVESRDRIRVATILVLFYQVMTLVDVIILLLYDYCEPVEAASRTGRANA